jgi:hypothetical protein
LSLACLGRPSRGIGICKHRTRLTRDPRPAAPALDYLCPGVPSFDWSVPSTARQQLGDCRTGRGTRRGGRLATRASWTSPAAAAPHGPPRSRRPDYCTDGEPARCSPCPSARGRPDLRANALPLASSPRGGLHRHARLVRSSRGLAGSSTRPSRTARKPPAFLRGLR